MLLSRAVCGLFYQIISTIYYIIEVEFCNLQLLVLYWNVVILNLVSAINIVLYQYDYSYFVQENVCMGKEIWLFDILFTNMIKLKLEYYALHCQCN